MSSVFNETFDSITPGQDVTTANTTYDQLTLGTGTSFKSISVGAHNNAARFTSPGGAGTSATIRKNFGGSTTSRYFRAYFRFSAVPSAVMSFWEIRSSLTFLADLQLATDGKIRLRDQNVLKTTSTTNIATNQWVRLEWFWNQAGNSQTVRIYTGSNLDSATTYDEQITATAGGGASDNSGIGIGASITTPPLTDIDDVADDNATWVGPTIVVPTSWVRHAVGGVWLDVVPHHAKSGTWH